jgi:hypothetical protein
VSDTTISSTQQSHQYNSKILPTHVIMCNHAAAKACGQAVPLPCCECHGDRLLKRY